ncbi:MAG: hypothetical protein ACI9EW_002398 [Cellvibrionaceae bacterium]|jgi:hypothetical protein
MERGLIDNKGELFAILRGLDLYTMDDELTGRIEGDYIVDLYGTRVWRVIGDGVYRMDGSWPVGYFGEGRSMNSEWID